MKSSPFQSPRLRALTGLTLLLIFGTLVTAVAQTYTGNVTFNSQASLDVWPNTYTQINGNVTIQGATITDLTPLANITSITGFLKLFSNTNLTQLDGLDAVTTIGNTLEINGNPLLTDVGGLGSINSLGFSLVVVNNAVLPNLDGLVSLTTIAEKITINNNALLANLDGLSNVTSIGASIVVQDNPSLNDCCGLYELINSPGVTSTFTNNNTGCDSKTQVNAYCGDADGDGINITDGDCNDTNPNIYPGAPEICDGLDNDCNEEVDEGLLVYNGNITLYTQAEVDAFSACITTINGSLLVGTTDIINNPISNIHDLSPLDNILAVTGTLNIANTELTSINGLSGLTQVGGLSIQFNENLSSISGLNALTTVAEQMSIWYNNLSNGINGFTNLENVGQGMLIGGNNALSTIAEFPNLLTVGSLYIANQDMLASVSGFDQLSLITTDCEVSVNPLLSDCCFIQNWIDNGVIGGALIVSDNATGCDNEQEIADHCVDLDLDGYTLSEGECDDNDPDIHPGAPELCDGLDNDCDGLVDEGLAIVNSNLNLLSQADVNAAACVEIVTGQLHISGNDIVDLTPLSGLTKVVGNFYITNNPSLTSLNGLEQLTYFGVGIYLEYNDLLSDASALQLPSRVHGALFVRSNPLLTNLDFAQNVTSVGTTISGNLLVSACNSLTNIDGLSNVAEVGNYPYSGKFILTFNPLLSECCAIHTLINTPGAVGDGVTIVGNNTTCETQAAVDAYCGDLDADGLSVQDGDCDDADPANFPGNTEICDGQDNDCDGNADEGLSVYIGNVTLYTQEEVNAFSSCITTINGSLLVGVPGCNIVDLSPLNNVEIVTGDVNIYYTQLISINGLTSLMEVGGYLNVSSNDNLLTLNNAFPSLVEIGSMIIAGNNSLTSIDGFNMMTVTGNPSPELLMGRVQINYNPNLTSIDGFEAVTSLPYSLELAGNALSGGVPGFANLQSIGGYLLISEDNAITTIDGFGNVNTILNLILNDNPQLVSVPGLGQLSAITGSCIITNNASLSACCFIQDWIDNSVIEGPLTVSDNATGCDSQQDIADHCVDGDADGFTVSDGDCDDNHPDFNPDATEICDGQDNDCDGSIDEGLAVYNGNITLTSQADVDQFSSCITVLNGVLTINGADITDLSPLSALTFVSWLNIQANPALASLEGLQQITAVSNLEISGTQLSSLSGLQGLDTIMNNCVLSNNDLLTNLDAFSGLQIVESYIHLTGNLSLIDITGIQHLIYTNNITVYGNPVLSDCCVLQDLKDAGSVGYLSISNNNTGCDSPQEVTWYCSDADEDGFTLTDGDCNDLEPDVFPGAPEICDDQDNDCNGLTDDNDPNITGQSTWYADADNDGAGDASSVLVSCTRPEGYVGNAEDLCPNDVDKTQPGSCGCGIADSDADADGIADCIDDCQASPDISSFDEANCQCEPGSYPVTIVVEGIEVITACQPCPAGYYCPDGLTSYPCPIGAYSNTVGSIACSVCQVCTTTQEEGSTSCTPETTAPTAICQDISINLDANGQATITGEMIDNGSSDACGIASLTPNQDMFSCADIGPNPVILTVTDNNGNTSTCVTTVTIADISNPVFVSCPSDISEGLCGGVVTWDEPVATDNCPDFTVQQIEGPANGSIFDEGETMVAYQVTDAAGLVGSCSFTVTVNAINVTGGPNLHAYYGYPNSVDLSATVSGGSAPYTYLWSPAGDLNDATDPTPTFTPSTFGTVVFTVTVTDDNGCTGTATQSVFVEDVQCGNNGNQIKIMICHDGETVCVNENAVSAHLAHGDYLGPCIQALVTNSENSGSPDVGSTVQSISPASGDKGKQPTQVQISPNPFREQVAIQLTLAEKQQQVSIRVYDMFGMFVSELYQGTLPEGRHTYQWLGENVQGDALSSGVYLIVVQSDAEIMTKQVVLMH